VGDGVGPGNPTPVELLLAVELDDEMLSQRDVDLLPQRLGVDLVLVRLVPLQPGRRGAVEKPRVSR
jgi:hypothetical protein